MKKAFLLLVILFGVLLVGCGGKPEIPSIPQERLSVEEAEGLVWEWFKSEPDMNSRGQVSLEETTQEEVWQRTGGQVFKVTEGIYQFYDFFMHAVSCNRNDNHVRTILALLEFNHLITCKCTDILFISVNMMGSRMTVKHLFVKVIKNDIVGSIFVVIDLVDDDVFFFFKLYIIIQRICD